ncbi:diaminobutyrate acetyltransferase [Paenibacillus agricola]|uniref:L-2,4-diaminobutyric acid acetyltransferase n=1 Tax=Paenibacillus agricola TaxID=2716264 RepID=A0ABX0JDB1_9BACL|nr:diaminobutyrate acetyltransferase [Paenibacillus agricola]NHN33241.1 diaminobutyrate acetyltransferase [Paenibacillus agricola]
MMPKKYEQIVFRKPTPMDGADMYQLVKESGVLDTNSEYCYLMLCKYFSDTCVIAESNGQMVGFVSAFQPPAEKDCMFIWQIAVSTKYQGSGIGTYLIQAALSQQDMGVRYIEATISLGNAASIALFDKIAKQLGSICTVSSGFESHHFSDKLHEAEWLHRIGPFSLEPSNHQLGEFIQ